MPGFYSPMLLKEWLKLRLFFFIGLALSVGFPVYDLLRLHRVRQMQGVQHLWEVMLQKDAIFVDNMQWLPLILGLLCAVAQFVPEMHRRTLKLTLHLPQSHLRSIAQMIAYGSGLLLVCFVVGVLVLLLGCWSILAREFIEHMLLSACTWYIAGLLAYYLGVWIIVEPTWRWRVINLLVAALLLRVFFLSSQPEAYNRFLPILLLYTLLSPCLLWRSVVRFRDGKQD